MDGLPYSQAAQNNSEPILAELRRLLAQARSVLEIGAGTGQHAVAFAAALPQLHWQPTEHPDALATLRPRCAAAQLPNLAAPRPLDIAEQPWPWAWPDALYTANTLHIVSAALVEALFAACAAQGTPGSLLIVYGPFNIGGAYTAASNERFDRWLRERDPASGIRDLEWVDVLAARAGYDLRENIDMPANNQLLVWERGSVSRSP